jgi:hypothetical protein
MLVVPYLKVVFVVGLGGARRGAAAGILGPFRLDVAEGRQLPAGDVALELLEPGLHHAPRTGMDGIGKVVGLSVSCGPSRRIDGPPSSTAGTGKV